MKIVGLIAEYNPFHNGHQYHIEKAKEIRNKTKHTPKRENLFSGLLLKYIM